MATNINTAASVNSGVTAVSNPYAHSNSQTNITTTNNNSNSDACNAAAPIGSAGDATATQTPLQYFPLFDAFLDIPHPGSSTASKVNYKRVIVAPPKEAFHLSKDVGVELATENGLLRVSAFCFPDYFNHANGNASANNDNGESNRMKKEMMQDEVQRR